MSWRDQFEHDGYLLIDGDGGREEVVPMDLIERMRDGLDRARGICRDWQIRNGLPNTDGTVHHLPALKDEVWLEFLETNPANGLIEELLDGPFILNSMGGNFNEGRNYASAIHRDIRSYQDPCPLLNTLVMLDDFLPDNGATILMSGGHNVFWRNKPHDHDFNYRSAPVFAPAGSILIWSSNLWHKAGENKSGKPRRIVTPIFSKPWFKQGFDYPRAIGYDADLSPRLRQVLGYNARVPATFDEWYQPPERRMYKGDQG